MAFTQQSREQVVSKLITKELVAAGDYDAISEKVAQVLAWIKEARRGVSR